jgi:hypothetical protein
MSPLALTVMPANFDPSAFSAGIFASMVADVSAVPSAATA